MMERGAWWTDAFHRLCSIGDDGTEHSGLAELTILETTQGPYRIRACDAHRERYGLDVNEDDEEGA